MHTPQFDVIGIGNAIVDVLAQTTDGFLNEQMLAKGAMTLIDEERAKELYQKLGQCIERSGGSVGNSMAGIASLGGRGAYIGKVANDSLGQVFTQDMRSVGTAFATEALCDSVPTARCLVLVTPDAQRTMATYLGACAELCPQDVDEHLISDSAITYLEGYLWDRPHAKDAFVKAARIAHEAGRKVALSLSDAFCVERHRSEFQALIADHIDILFANEREILALYQHETFEQAASHVRTHCEVAALTRSENGSVVVSATEQHEIPAYPVKTLVDTTGAGDLYAAGFLFGYTRRRGLAECAKIGALAAAEIISHYGARPEVKLSDWIGPRL